MMRTFGPVVEAFGFGCFPNLAGLGYDKIMEVGLDFAFLVLGAWS